jgi:hypothetical protein
VVLVLLYTFCVRETYFFLQNYYSLKKKKKPCKESKLIPSSNNKPIPNSNSKPNPSKEILLEKVNSILVRK